MKPATYNLDLYRGDSAGFEFHLYDDEEKTIPSDLTGVEAHAQIRPTAGGALTLEMGTGIVDNVITVSIEPADWVEIGSSFSKGVWDLQLTYPDGAVRTYVKGAVAVDADVTVVTP